MSSRNLFIIGLIIALAICLWLGSIAIKKSNENAVLRNSLEQKAEELIQKDRALKTRSKALEQKDIEFTAFLEKSRQIASNAAREASIWRGRYQAERDKPKKILSIPELDSAILAHNLSPQNDTTKQYITTVAIMTSAIHIITLAEICDSTLNKTEAELTAVKEQNSRADSLLNVRADEIQLRDERLEIANNILNIEQGRTKDERRQKRKWKVLTYLFGAAITWSLVK